MSEPRRHHLVPEFYLRKFANADNRVHVTQLPGDRSYTTHTKNVAVETGFYDVAGVDEEARADVENALSTVESHAARAWSAFDAGAQWPPTPDQVGGIAAWVTLQYARGRSSLWRWNELGRTLLRLQVIAGGRRALRAQLGDINDDRLEELLAQAHDDSLNFTPPRNEYLKMMLKLVADHAHMFAGYTWTLMEFERRRLATCDDPVLLIDHAPQPEEGIGLLSADMVAVPVSRSQALLLQRGRSLPDSLIPGTTAFARMLNQRTAVNAERYVIHHPDDAPFHGIYLPDPRTPSDYAPMVEDLTRFAPSGESPPARRRCGLRLPSQPDEPDPPARSQLTSKINHTWYTRPCSAPVRCF